MFTPKELKAIDPVYFSIIASNGSAVTLQSNNTGHCWHILLEEYPHFRSCRIYHTHRRGTPYHEHGHGATLSGCIQKIRSHDTYWLGRERAYRKRRRKHHKTEEQEVRS
ncbi:hypothetical protein [Enterocloster clostridioformis]|uniref:hypothetical protein n=1 Tax=Enterocloster clostridioformis TaxID=1531 RepID=UPI0005D1BB62|nr:hypothetical protein [Enterocloster clostridioformis]